MASLFSTPKPVAPTYNVSVQQPVQAAAAQEQAPQTAPTVAAKPVQDAGSDETAAVAQAKGRGSTILTSGLGDTSTPTLGKKTLLGS